LESCLAPWSDICHLRGWCLVLFYFFLFLKERKI
jgi:hypothetical protein